MRPRHAFVLASAATLAGGLLVAPPVTGPTAAGPVGAGISGWTWQYPTPQGNSLHDLRAKTTSLAWAVGEYGTVLRTRDGGRTWARQGSHTTADLAAVDFVGTTRGWVVGSGGTLLRTTDAGAHWTRTVVGPGWTQLTEVDFATRYTGYVGDSMGVLRKSRDRGARWRTLPLPVDLQGVTALAFPSTTTGWVAGVGGALLRTTNGGSTWSVQAWPRDPYSGSDEDDDGEHITDLSWRSSSTAWAVTSHGKILRTTNGGRTWRLQDRFGGGLSSIHMQSSSVGWAVGGTSLVRTTDGGRTWRRTATANAPYAVAGLSTTRALGVGRAGATWRTTTTGRTWTRIGGGSASTWRDVDFATGSTGWAVGERGGSAIVYRTTQCRRVVEAPGRGGPQ